MINLESVFRMLVEEWPNDFVFRQDIKEFSRGIMSPGYMAILDSQGKGPVGKFKIGKRVAYPADEVIKWLKGMVRSCR